MATNAFGMNVPDRSPSKPSPKQVQAALRQQRQADARRSQAQRDRDRNASRTATQQRTKQLTSSRTEGQSRSTPRPTNAQLAQRKIDTALPRGKSYTTDDVDWLQKHQGEKREKKEQELLQSLRDRGITTFTEGDGKAAWIEDTYQDDEWEPDYSGEALGIYENSDISKLMG